MASISTAVELTDRMTYPLNSIASAMGNVIEIMENMNTSMNEAFDDSKINSARISIDEAKASISAITEQFNNARNGANNFGNNINNVANKQEQLNRKLQEGTTASNSFIKSLMGFSVIQKIIGLVSSQVGNAIDRLDTMNNYPKVMSNLGISSDQANASIKMLSENLKGLPTTLNDAVSSVQNFTSVNGSVGKSTKMFLALNNAILAGGGTTQVQQSALEQLSQAYAKGKPDMMEWRTAMTAMPAQLKQVAQAMGYVNTSELGEALRSGKESMDDFMDTFIQLNEKGVNGFQSFEDQARNATGGFATTIANMKSAVTRGIGNMITSINTALESAGLGTIQETIVGIGANFEVLFTNIGNFVANIVTLLQPIISVAQIIGQGISDNWSIISPILYGLIAVLAIYATYTGIATMATKAWSAVQAVFNGIMSMNPVMLIVLGIIALIAVIFAVISAINKWKGTNISAVGAICGVINVVIQFFWNLLQTVANIALGIWNALGACADNIGIAFKNVISNIKSWFYGLLETVTNVITSIVNILNKIPFINIDTTGLTSKAQEYANKKADAENSKEAYKSVSAAFDEGMSTFETWQDGWAANAYNAGYDFGSGLQDDIGNMFSNGLNINGISDNLGLNLDSSLANIAGNTADTASNTGKINDVLSSTEEDLKYLRDLAESEVINRYTTNEIKVEMTNNNNINSDMDIDGVVDYLTNGVNEAMEQAAEGVHE